MYVDDIVIKSHTEKIMLRDTLETFESLRKVNMKLNPKKCTFGTQEGKFLGHIVTERGIKANPKKIQAIEDMTEEAEIAFQDVKRLLKELPTLIAPVAGETLILYMAASAEAINQQIKQILKHPESSGCSAKWAVELGEYEINFSPRHAVKGQILADFLLETTEKVDYSKNVKSSNCMWELHTDGVSSEEGVGAGLVLTSPEGEEHTYALKFCFYASNHELEYEALLSDIRISSEMGIKHLRAYVDSQIVAQQVNRAFEAKDISIIRYFTID
ncbi:uncharacterized protein [Rutidosis leptorrhynchoides]|uniref:uncharacterized protein n=1 Tax=Rutidosis leptorrhynchoides TaxID=125765 RepID=UPI003A9A5243